MICVSINLKQCWHRSCGLCLCVMWSHLGKEKFMIRHVSMWVGFLVCRVMSWYWWGVTEAYFDRSQHSWHCDQIPHHSVYMSQCTYMSSLSCGPLNYIVCTCVVFQLLPQVWNGCEFGMPRSRCSCCLWENAVTNIEFQWFWWRLQQ